MNNDIAKFKNETTKQLTTFNLEKNTKTVIVPKGEKVTIGEVEGQGTIYQL